MKSNLLITRLTEKDIEGAYELFKITIPDTFKKSGGEWEKELIEEEIHHKKEILYEAVNNKSILFWVAKDKWKWNMDSCKKKIIKLYNIYCKKV